MSSVPPGGTLLARGAAAGPAALVRPRGRNLRWAIIGVICLLTIANYMDRGNLSVAAPLVMKDLGVSNTMMGVVLSAFVWPYAIMNLPAGWLVDRFGAKLLLACAAGAWSLVSMATGLATSIGQFLGLRIALGISEAPLFPGALKATNAWFPDQEKAAATSVYIATTQVGLAVAPPIATALMVAFGWPAMFVIIGLFGFVAMLGWLAIYHDPAAHPRISAAELAYVRAGQSGRTAAPDGGAAVGLPEWSGLFRQPAIWTMIVGGFCLQYTFWFYITWLPTYLQRAQHFTLSHAGYLSALPFIAGAAGVLAGGRVSDALVARGMAPFHARRAVVATGALLTAATMIATTLSPNAVVAVGLLTTGMFTYSLSSGCYWTLATDVLTTPRFVASVGSIQNFGGFLGGACAPIGTGLLVDRFGSFTAALLVTAALALVSAAMYGLLLRRRMAL